MLPSEAVMEYQIVYKRVFGTEIAAEEARQQSENLIKSFKLIFKPVKKNAKPKTD